MHPKKGMGWLKDKYWSIKIKERQDKWVFGYEVTIRDKERHMPKLAWTPIKRHIKVKGNNSPFDKNLRDYWLKREKKQIAKNNISSGLLPKGNNALQLVLSSPLQLKIASSQKGRCPICMASLLNGEMLHIHHKLPKAKGGKDNLANLSILHSECHRKAHSLNLGKGEIERRQSFI